MKKGKVFLSLCLWLLLSQTLWGQFVVKVTGTDGSGITDTLTLAIDPAGTAGFDSLSPTLREYEIPVAAKGLDFRFVNNFPYDVIGAGSYTSIHHMTLPTQTDKWKFQFNVDSGRTNFLMQWPAGLAGVGGGYWRLIPDPADAITFSDVDMTTSTSISIPVSDIEQHTFFVVEGDGQKYRSFSIANVVLAADSKGAIGKAEKRKPIASEGTFTFTNNNGHDVTDLHIEWSQTLNPLTYSVSRALNGGFGFTDVKVNKQDMVFAAPVANGGQVVVFAQGNKGKALQAKKWWWTVGGVMDPPKVKNAAIDPNPGRLLYAMPNINNIGEEAYSQVVFPVQGASVGLTVGDPNNAAAFDIKGKPIIRAVVHPKWKDVLKTLSDKTGVQNGTPDCLLNFIGGKPITKLQKALPPAKYSSALLGEAVTLRINIGAGDAGKVEEGGTAFGDLHYVRQTGDPAGVPANVTVRNIADSANTVLICHTSGWGGTYAEWTSMMNRINGSFSGPFDTLSFFDAIPPPHPKTSGTVAKGVRPLVEVPYLYRTSYADILPQIKAPDIAALEARNQPDQYKLMQNYPNPFNPATTIEFAIPVEGFVTMKVYNILGQEVATLIDHELMDQGTNEVTFDATNFASGVYYYKMLVNDGQFQQIKKMMLVK